MASVERFEPAKYSLAELAFMREHLGESPNVAMHAGVPKNVNPDAIRDTLARFVELEELQKVRNVPWAGLAPIRDSIDRFIAFQDKCLEGYASGEPRHPSQKTWDSMGNMTDGGIGSDSSDMVRTELLPDGSRRPFAVELVNITKRKSRMWGVKVAGQTVPDAITHDNGTYTCTICEKMVASYDTDKGTRVRNKARADARKHCMKATKEIARHRAIANVPVE